MLILAINGTTLNRDALAKNEKMQTDWKTETTDQAAQKVTSVLAPAISRQEVDEARQAYRALFLDELEALGELSPSMVKSIFADAVEQKIREVSQASAEDQRNILKRDVLISKVVGLDRMIERTGEDVIRGKKLTPEARARIAGARDTLNVLADAVRGSREVESRVQHRISDSMLDTYFLLEGGEPTSLRLSKFNEYVRLQRRSPPRH
jgi:hypothetical protein